MKRLGMILALAVLGSACANVTTTKIYRGPDGELRLESGKDVQIGEVVIDVAPGDRYVVKMKDYSSNANVDVITAQSAREAAIAAGAIQAIEAGIKIGAKAVVPVP